MKRYQDIIFDGTSGYCIMIQLFRNVGDTDYDYISIDTSYCNDSDSMYDYIDEAMQTINSEIPEMDPNDSELLESYIEDYFNDKFSF